MSGKKIDPRDRAETDPKPEDKQATASSNPVGAAAGALAGAAAGATVGILGGPVGLAAGAVAGAVAGGKLGAEELRAVSVEDEYWRQNHSTRPYVRAETSYDDYGPAYRYGVASHLRHQNRSWDDARTDIEAGWPDARGESRLEWQDAEPAVRDAWERRVKGVR